MRSCINQKPEPNVAASVASLETTAKTAKELGS